MDKKIRYGTYAAIVNLILTLPVIIFSGHPIFRLLLLFYITTAFIVYYLGYKTIADKTNNKLMKNAIQIIIAYVIVVMLNTLIAYATPRGVPEIWAPAVTVASAIYGVATIVLGVSILALEKQFGRIAVAAAILGIMGGALYTTSQILTITANTGTQQNNPLGVIPILTFATYVTLILVAILSGIVGTLLLYQASEKL